jgi:WD40 repeat protein
MPVEARAIAASGDGAVVAVLGDADVRLLAGRRKAPRASRLRIALEAERALALDSHGTRLALWRADDNGSAVRIFDVASGRQLSRWDVPSRLNDLRFGPGGEQVVLALMDFSVQVWQCDQGAPIAMFRHPTEASSACFTAVEGLVVSGSWDGTARIWPWKAETLIQAASARLERDLTESEWAQYLPGESYRRARG